MNIKVFFCHLPFVDAHNTEMVDLLFHYLIKKSFANDKFFARFESVALDYKDILLTPESIIDKNNTVINPNQFIDTDAFFILAELDWYNHKFTDYYGLKVAQKLRLANIISPIFICSFLPESYLVNNRQYKILNFRGNYFIHLPEGFKDIFEIEPLDEMELLDCKMHYCGIEGAIRDIYHKKQHIIYEEDFDKAKIQILDLLEEIIILNDLPDYLKPEIEKLKNEVKKKTTITELKIFCKEDDSKILSHLREQDKDVKSSQLYDEVKGDWQILFLEDVSEDIESLKNSFVNADIKKENLLLASTYNEAVEKIENDKGNKITVVICDFGLEKDGKLKGRQGYTFVEWLSKQDRFNEIYVYSGRARKFLKEVFKKFNIRVTVNSKYDVVNRMSDFVDGVIEKGNEVAELILNQPTADNWRKLKIFYRNYRAWPGYEYMEREINEISHNVIKQFKFLRETTENLNLSDKDLPVSGILTFPNLSGDLYKEFPKEAVDVNPELLSGYENYNIQLYSIGSKGKKKNEENVGNEELKDCYYCFYPISNEKYREKYFKNKLIARRIALWFLFIEGLHANTVFSLLRNGEYRNYYFVKNPEKQVEYSKTSDKGIPETSDYKSVVNTDLAIVKEDFPFNLLVEEKNWFKYEMGVDLNDLMSVICGFEYYFNELFENFSYKINQKRADYSELVRDFIINGKFLFHSANDIRKALELSINCLENIDDKKDLIFKVLDRYDENDIICKTYFEKLKNFATNQLRLLKNK